MNEEARKTLDAMFEAVEEALEKEFLVYGCLVEKTRAYIENMEPKIEKRIFQELTTLERYNLFAK